MAILWPRLSLFLTNDGADNLAHTFVTGLNTLR
jgi:hypothetical protein